MRLSILPLVTLMLACGTDIRAPYEPQFATAPHALSYVPHDLGPGTATGINSNGDIVGYLGLPPHASAWMRLRSGTYHVLEPDQSGMPGDYIGCEALAFSINDRGVVAGQNACRATPGATSGAVYWTRELEPIRISVGAGEQQWATGINNRNDIVGLYRFELQAGAYSWYRSERGVLELLWAPAGPGLTLSTASAVSDAGVVAGTVNLCCSGALLWTPHAYRWTARADAEPDVSDVLSEGYAVDASGRVGGALTDEPFGLGFRRPAVWAADGTWSLLPDLGLGGSVQGMNRAGDAVGVVGNHAAHWTSAGVLTVLPPLPGFTSATAVAINDAGWVVGHSSRSDPYESRATLWALGVASASLVLSGEHQALRITSPLPPRDFTSAPACSEKWRHYVEAGGSCPDDMPSSR